MTTAVATVQERQQMYDLLTENMDGETLTTNDLVRVKVPNGSTTWEIPAGEGEDPISTRVIEGVIVAKRAHRIYFQEAKDNEKNPPACQSDDGVIGIGTPGGACASCPLAQYGTKGKGQACSARTYLYVMREDDFMPISIDLPPSSLQPLKKYMTQLSTLARVPFYGVKTRLTLKKVEASAGRYYSVVQFALAGKLDVDETENYHNFKDMFLDMLKATARQKDDNAPAIQGAMTDDEFQTYAPAQKPAKVVDADDPVTF